MPHNADLIRMRPAQPVAQNGQWPPRQARFWLKMSPELPFTLFFYRNFLIMAHFCPSSLTFVYQQGNYGSETTHN